MISDFSGVIGSCIEGSLIFLWYLEGVSNGF